MAAISEQAAVHCATRPMNILACTESPAVQLWFFPWKSIRSTWQQDSCALLHVLNEIQHCNVRVQASNSSACTPWVLSEPNHHRLRAIKAKHFHLITMTLLLLLANPKYLMLWFIICAIYSLYNVQSLTENYNNSLYSCFLTLRFLVSSMSKAGKKGDTTCSGNPSLSFSFSWKF